MGIVPGKSAFRARDKALAPIRLTNAATATLKCDSTTLLAQLVLRTQQSRKVVLVLRTQVRRKEKIGSRPRPFLFFGVFRPSILVMNPGLESRGLQRAIHSAVGHDFPSLT